MKRIFMSVAWALLLVASVAQASDINTWYRTRVITSFGTTFFDCYKFDFPFTEFVQIELLVNSFAYRHGNLNNNANQFQAVTNAGQPNPRQHMFHGRISADRARMNGRGMDLFAETYTLRGTADPACVPDVVADRTPYDPQ